MSVDDDRWLALQRQALLGATAALAAHEFGNLMTPVLARSQQARDGGDVTEMRKALDCTVVHTDRAMAITRRLLETTRGAPLVLRPHPVAEALHHAFTALARPLEKDGIEVVLDLDEGAVVLADALLFEQLLANLLLDAREALSAAGGGRLSVSARRQGDRVCIELCDSGVAVPDAENGVYLPNGQDHPSAWKRQSLPLAACTLIAEFHQATFTAQRSTPPRLHTLVWPSA